MKAPTSRQKRARKERRRVQVKEMAAKPQERWTFFGRVLPERVPLSIDQTINGQAEIDLGFTYDYSIWIFNSQVIANVAMVDGNTDIHTLKNVLDNTVRSLVDIMCHQRGLSFDIEIIAASNRDNDLRYVFGIGIPALIQKRAEVPSTFTGDLLIALGARPGAHVALASFREAMRVAAETGFFCYRAIEAAMQTMKPAEPESAAASWARFRTALLVDRAVIDLIKTYADGPRHGHAGTITDAQRATVLLLTDEILDRYLNYLAADDTPMDPATVPQLVLPPDAPPRD